MESMSEKVYVVEKSTKFCPFRIYGDNFYCLPSCALAKIKPDYDKNEIMWKCGLGGGRWVFPK